MRAVKRSVPAVLALLIACGDSTGPAGTGRVSLSFTGVRPVGAAPSAPGSLASVVQAPGDSLVISDGTNTLIITRVEVLLREIELKRVTTVDCDSVANEDACEKFETGARLITLPLVPAAATALAIDVDPGTYSEIEFDVHKLGNDSTDNAFRAASPGWPSNTSIRVTGFYNGTPFTYTSDVNAEQEESLVPPMVVEAGGTANVTVRIDVSVWFRNGATGPLINPATAGQGGPNKSLVENNIQNSIKAFEDDDKDGDERDG